MKRQLLIAMVTIARTGALVSSALGAAPSNTAPPTIGGTPTVGPRLMVNVG